MKHCKGTIGGLLALSLTIGGVIAPLTSAEAATKAQIKEAKAAYADYLKENSQINKYCVMDVFGDNLPELMIVDDYGITMNTYMTEYKYICPMGNGSKLSYHPTKKYYVFTNTDKYSDFDEEFFKEAVLYGNSEAWDQMDLIKTPSDITSTTITKYDKDGYPTVSLISYNGKVKKTGKTFSGYWEGSKISKASYDKKYKSVMSGTKKITKFVKNSASNRKKLK